MPAKKRPCRICRRWFQPKPQVGDRQRVCSSPGCQRERHRRSDRAWHARHPDYDRDRRLREKLDVEAGEEPVDPLRQVSWGAVQEAIGLEGRIVAEVVAGKLARVVQDVASAQAVGMIRKSGRLPLGAVQDAASPEPLEIMEESGRLALVALQDECDRVGPAP